MVKIVYAPIAFGLAFISSIALAEPDIEWMDATASGTGCSEDSVTVTITPGGREISWSFNDFEMQLAGSPKTAQLFCRLNAFANVKKGLYIAEVAQDLEFMATKSAHGSSISLSAASTFFDSKLSPLKVSYGEGEALFQSAETISSIQKLVFPGGMVAEDFCKHDRPTGLFQATVSGIASISAGGNATLSVQGQNVNFKAVTMLKECP